MVAWRLGKANLSDAYARFKDGQLYMMKAHIARYESARDGHEPERERRLLLHRRELDRLAVKVRERGLTLVPVELYFKQGRAKVALALARGKRQFDKRSSIAERENERRLRRVTKRRQRRSL